MNAQVRANAVAWMGEEAQVKTSVVASTNALAEKTNTVWVAQVTAQA